MAHTYGYTDPGGQAWMILDEVRTKAYADAIGEVVQPDDVVLDFGSGSGVLALLAAKAGARRVFAVERSDAADLIRSHVQENGLSEIVQVIQADLLELTPGDFDAPATVVLSEMLGHFAPDEHMHRLYAAARKLARPDARLIPESYRVCVALADLGDLDTELRRLEDLFGVRLGTLADRLRSRVAVTAVTDDALLGPESGGAWYAVDARLPDLYAAEVEIARTGVANAIVASFETRLSPSVTLSTRASDPPTHWRQSVFPLYPKLEVRGGATARIELEPRLVTARGTWLWRAESEGRVAGGDAMDSLVGGDIASVAEQLGLRIQRPLVAKDSARLQAARVLFADGVVGQPVDALAERLLAALPQRFADDADARQEVLAILGACGAT